MLLLPQFAFAFEIGESEVAHPSRRVPAQSIHVLVAEEYLAVARVRVWYHPLADRIHERIYCSLIRLEAVRRPGCLPASESLCPLVILTRGT